jgi:RNA polymerase sigma factor (TIGR02999 family)
MQDLLSTGTLVHEVWIQLSRRSALSFEEHGSFLAYAARAMRGLVIDQVRSRNTQKRGGGLVITSLDTHSIDDVLQPDSLDRLNEAMEELALLEPGLAEVVDLKFFCGFTLVEIAAMKGLSDRTVQRQWEKARTLLHCAMC